MDLLTPHKGMKVAAGFLTVIPANAGIQGVRAEDGFRAPARGRIFAGMTEVGGLSS